MWKVRHQGSPSALGELTLPQVVEGLVNGRWEPMDEVMGPSDKQWVPIENHPQLEAVAAELEPPEPRHYDDETHLDMNALIDVCLVLLIFFILTTSYAVIQKRLEAPGVSGEKVGPAVVTKSQVEQSMVFVTARMKDGHPVIQVEQQEVDLNRLEDELRKYKRQTGKTVLLFDPGDDVPQSIVVAVLDAAKGATMEKVSFVVSGRSKR